MDKKARECLIVKIFFAIVACLLFSCLAYYITISYMNMDKRPSLCIQDLSVPALKNPNPTLFNATPLDPSILIDIKFKDRYNPTQWEKGCGSTTPINTKYADLQMTVFYGVERRLPVANHTLPGFRMSGRITLHKRVVINAPGLPWEDAINKVSGGLPVTLVVGLAVKYADHDCSRVDQCSWPEGMVWADVAVDASGDKVSKKTIAFAYDRYRY